MPHLFHISASQAFIASLQSGLVARFSENLADVVVLLPNRRLCRALKEQFVNYPTSPRIIALEDSAALLSLSGNTSLQKTLSVIDMIQLCAGWLRDNARLNDLSPEDRLDLAKSLVLMLEDQVRYQLPGSVLDQQAVERESYLEQLFKEIARRWQDYCNTHQVMSHAQLQQKALTHIVARSHEFPTVLAGSVGSVTSTRELMKQLLACQHSYVVLPGLDTSNTSSDLPHKQHPQSLLRELCDALSHSPKQVPLWHGELTDAQQTMQRFWSAVMDDSYVEQSAPHNIELIECQNSYHEAQIIVQRARELNGNVAIITQNDPLTRELVSQCDAQGLAVDNLLPWHTNLPGELLELLLLISTEQADYSDMLALLKQPLLASLLPADWDMATFERDSCRGVQPPMNAQRLQTLLPAPMVEWLSPLLKESTGHHTAEAWYGLEKQIFEPILSEEAYESFCAIGTHLFRDERPIAYADYHALRLFWMQHVAVAGRDEASIWILPPIEARLLTCDHVIIPEMNRGTWPKAGVSNRFTERFIVSLGLPGVDHYTSLAAHDLVTLASAAETVTITRARESSSGLTDPSGWWHRLQLFLPVHTEMIERVQPVGTADMPAPNPPLEARPTTFWASDIELLINNPYAYYARHILALQPLDEVDQPVDARLYGVLVHRVLEESYKGGDLNSLAQEYFLTRTQQDPRYYPWYTAFCQVIPWIEDQNNSLSGTARVEHILSHSLSVDGCEITLSARADKIVVADEAVVIDYKTGALPSGKKIAAGTSPQLPILGWLWTQSRAETPLKQAEFWAIGRYLSQCKTQPFAYSDVLHAEISEGLEGLLAHFLVTQQPYLPAVQNSATAFYHHYDHLSRAQEWE